MPTKLIGINSFLGLHKIILFTSIGPQRIIFFNLIVALLPMVVNAFKKIKRIGQLPINLCSMPEKIKTSMADNRLIKTSTLRIRNEEET